MHSTMADLQTLRSILVREEPDPGDSYRPGDAEPAGGTGSWEGRDGLFATSAADLARRYRALPRAERAWVTRVVDAARRRHRAREADPAREEAVAAALAKAEEEARRDEEAFFRHLVEAGEDADAVCLLLGWSEAEYEDRLRTWKRPRRARRMP